MSVINTHGSTIGGSHSKLSIKITGIVFWGLVVTGLLLTYLLQRNIEDETVDAIDAFSERASLQIYEALHEKKAILSTDDLEAIRDQLGLLAIKLEVNKGIVQVGEINDALTHRDRNIALNSWEIESDATVAKITVYFEPIDKIVSDKRKRFITLMGVLFVAFGLILQSVLQRILTAPFIRMVEIAKAVSDGNRDLRFNENRDDEFGYLAKFINQSLEFLNKQRTDIENALLRIQESEAELYHEKERAEVTLHSIGDAVITTDAHGNIEYMNPAAEKLTGWKLSVLKGLSIDSALIISHEMNEQDIVSPVTECLGAGSVVELSSNYVLRVKGGVEVPFSSSAAPIRDHSDKIIGAVFVIQDETETRRMAKQLDYQAKHDPLTDLYNRRAFESYLEAAILKSHSGNTSYALCYLDLDQFKIVNDTCGHAAGDALLRQLPALLTPKLNEHDILARLGGDELGVLLYDCNREGAIASAERLRTAIKDFRFLWDEHAFAIGVSIGVVTIDKEFQSIAELLTAADVACYTAKDLGRDRIHVYERDDIELKQRYGEMQWVSHITKAIDERRFVIHYQPIISACRDNFSDAHYEILVRMLDKNNELIPPDKFIPAAERFNLMPHIDRFVISAALEFLGSKQGSFDCKLAINLSGQSVGDPITLEHIKNEIDRTGVNPEYLCFEVTETAAMANFINAEKFIHELKAKGCQFALDDFGSGLSSFAYLKNMQVDFLKIDGRFIRNMDTNETDYAIVEAICKVGAVMGIKTIAEYVESVSILNELRKIGVDYVQGYHIAVPAPVMNWQPYTKNTSNV